MKVHLSKLLCIVWVFALLCMPSGHAQQDRTERPTPPPRTPNPTNPPRTERPTSPPRTPNPTNPPRTPNPTNPPRTPNPTNPPRTPNPTNPPRTPNPTNPPRTPHPTNPPRTDRPTLDRSRTPRPTRTRRPTRFRTKRPARTPRPTRTRRPTRAGKPTVHEDECYEIEGNPAIIRGDPHYTTFAGVNHDFQGLPDEGLDQFYYIYPCDGFNHNDLPYHMIGRHIKYKTKQVSTLDYIVLELFEESGDQFVLFFSSGIHGYAKSDDTNYGTVTGLQTFVSGAATMIGTRFKVMYEQVDAISITVTLTVDSECDLKFTMIAQNDYNSDLERYTMHYVRVNPPDCYKCAVCGLLGDFQGDEMQTCDGSTTVPYGGYTNAWDARGWTWEKTYTNEQCGVSFTTTTLPPGATPSPTEKYVPPPDPTFPYDPCNDEESALKSASTKKCNDALNREDVQTCCNKIGDIFCQDLLDNCPFDACFTAEGEESSLDAQVTEVLVDPILAECDELIIDEDKYSTKTPTAKPTAPPATCCKDQLTQSECLDNYISGKRCLWLAPTDPLSIKFGTQCLGKSLIENGPAPPLPGFSGENPITDICHPIEVRDDALIAAVDMNGAKTRSMTGYAPQFHMIAALASVATILVIFGLYTMMCKTAKEDRYHAIADPLV